MKKPPYITKSKWNKEQKHVQARLEIAGKSPAEVLSYLYDRLNIIDAKVAALLTFNSILLTAAGLAGGKIDNFPYARTIFLFFAAPAWFISTLLCLFISFLKWEHLDKDDSASFENYRDIIIKVTTRRTCAYNFAVALIFALIVVLSVWVWLGTKGLI